MKLTTVSVKTSPRSSRIHWRTGERNRGVVYVSVDFDAPDVEIICELIAIRFLMFEKKVFNVTPSIGTGFQLTVSKGAIRKIMQGKSDKKHVIKFASFIMSDLKGITLKVDNNMKFLPKEGDEDAHVDHVSGDIEKYTNTHTKIETPVLGDVHITAHAVEQYAARHESAGLGLPSKPKQALTRRLQDHNLIKVALPTEVLEHKAKKYGTVDNVEFWSKHNTGIYFVIVNGADGKKTLVTTYTSFQRSKL